MVETNWDEIEEKIRKHRLKRLKRLAVIVGICLAAVIAYYVFMQHKSYTDYTVREEISRTDTPATHYVAVSYTHLDVYKRQDIILIPEIPYNINKVVEAIDKRTKQGKGFTEKRLTILPVITVLGC